MSNRYEQQFLSALQDIFVGAKVEGESGYINLMKIKARYFSEGVFPRLMQDIDTVCQPFAPAFREELFDKLYDFFQRYFSESGSIYFRHTALHHNVYEKVYTDDRDVMLFWKTHMLYYVKTDRLFHSMTIEVDNTPFYFDVSKLDHKRANEKRALLYELKGVKDGTIQLAVAYTEKGRVTKTDDILRSLKQTGITLDEETLTRATRLFEKQSEVDYFINKNAKAFLEEQFNLWLYQYVFSGLSEWTETRLKQLQAIKTIAYNIITFIAQFEDELVRVWQKPRFVRNSHYILTLDKISDTALLDRLLAHPGMQAQVQEWQDLGMLDDETSQVSENLTGLAETLQARDLTGAPLYPALHYLPLDTRHFPDLEPAILAQFDDLDAALDGWLIHSENYQALNTILPKFQGKISCVHIDPPYNTNSSGFLYVNFYAHSSWLAMMYDRCQLTAALLEHEGVFACHIDEYEFERLNLLFDTIRLDNAGTLVWDKGMPVTGAYGLATQHEYVIWKTKGPVKIRLKKRNIEAIQFKVNSLLKKNGVDLSTSIKEYRAWLKTNPNLSPGERTFDSFGLDGRVYRSDNMSATDKRKDEKFYQPLIHPITKKPCPVPHYGWRYSPKSMQELLSQEIILFGEDETNLPRKKTFLEESESSQMPSVYKSGMRGKYDLDNYNLAFPFAHSTDFYEYILDSAAPNKSSIVLDFFGGSGTSAHAVMNLNREDGGRRKYILVEMGEHFYSVILPRIKKVAFSDKWKDGKAQNGQGMSHFVKYYDLEQYEETLRRAHYEDAPLLARTGDAYSSYVFLRDRKLLDAITLDTQANQIHVHLERLYPDIDLAETLSHITGKGIKQITPEQVIFQDGTSASLTQPDWALIKPLI